MRLLDRGEGLANNARLGYCSIGIVHISSINVKQCEQL
jgi:hypothetical protein